MPMKIQRNSSDISAKFVGRLDGRASSGVKGMAVAGIPLEFHWNFIGISLEFHWNFIAKRLERTELAPRTAAKDTGTAREAGGTMTISKMTQTYKFFNVKHKETGPKFVLKFPSKFHRNFIGISSEFHRNFIG